MKKRFLYLLPFLLFAVNSYGFKQEDLDKLKAINQCIDCKLTEAPLFGFFLNGANLQAAKLDFANFTYTFIELYIYIYFYNYMRLGPTWFNVVV